MVVKDKTYQMLYDLILCDIKDPQVEQYKIMLDQWIAARDSIIDVFIETLEIRREALYLTNQEKSLIEVYRCLDPKTKLRYEQDIRNTYELECRERSAK